MSSVMRTQRQEWLEHLEAQTYFDDITILTEDKKDIANEIQRALGTLTAKAGKSGVVAVIFTVTAKPGTDDAFGPVLEFMHMVRVLENPVINRGTTGTNKTYEEIIEQIVGVTHGQFKPATGASPFRLESPGIALGNDDKYPSKDAFFSCSGSLAVSLSTVATPGIAEDAGEITLTCATAGAAIFYTVDGKKPRPGLTLYTAPFTPAAGVLVRARAWLPGLLASEIAELQT